ncbi:MAG TPA: beta-galactosidase [Gemmatimonadaceae bacterium]|nr:beta-galactosidase [Gemmatimonadaceae bacterium]
MSFAILEDYDVGDDLRDVARDFALFRALGVRTWRGSISWLEVEPERGRYDFGWLHRFARLAADSGITLRPYIAYTPEWAARGGEDSVAWNDPPRDGADWTRFVRALALALRRHPNVRSLEIYNEENTPQWWDGTRGAYDSTLAAAAAAIREADPDAQVLLGGMVWPDAAWAGAACDAARVDAVPFHAYPETWTPDSVTVESYLHDFGWATFLPAWRAHCRGAPVWIDETGFATVPGKTERDQALWWARAIPTFLAEPAVQQIGIYEIKDLRAGAAAIGGAPNYHLGLTYSDRRPKLAFSTVRLLVRLLNVGTLTIGDPGLGVTVTRGTRGAGTPYVHDFIRPDGTQVLFAWDRDGDPELRVRLPRSGRTATEWSLDGTGRSVRAFDGRTIDSLRLAPGEVRIIEIDP